MQELQAALVVEKMAAGELFAVIANLKRRETNAERDEAIIMGYESRGRYNQTKWAPIKSTPSRHRSRLPARLLQLHVKLGDDNVRQFVHVLGGRLWGNLRGLAEPIKNDGKTSKRKKKKKKKKKKACGVRAACRRRKSFPAGPSVVP